MNVEIEIRSNDSAGSIYDFRNYLERNLQGLQLEVETHPEKEGHMGGELDWLDPLGMGLMHGLWAELGKGGITLLVQGGKKVYQLYKEWKKNQPPVRGPQKSTPNTPGTKTDSSAGASPFRMSMGEGDQKVYLFEDKNGELKVYSNFDFTLVPEKTYALLVGTSEFTGEFTAIPPVRSNLVDFYNLITDKAHIGIPRANIEVLLNKTAEDIQAAMLRMSRKEGMDTFILYYSGHGYKVDLNTLVLVANNTRKIEDDIIAGIPLNFITEKVLKRSTAHQKILILDACHSGLATQGDADILRNLTVEGTYILTSSGDEPSFFEKKEPHTFFTGALLDLLDSGVSDDTKEMISLDDLYRFSSEKLATNNFPKPQCSSQLNIFPSSFFIARNPYFSEEKLKQLPRKLMDEKRFDEALAQSKKLVRRYPDDDGLRRLRDQCQDEVDYLHFALEGDKAYYVLKNYQAAVKSYEDALNLRHDTILEKKLAECKKLLAGTPSPPATATVQPQPVREKDSYEFTDGSITVRFGAQSKRPPLIIAYSDISGLSFARKEKKLVVTFNQATSSAAQNLVYGSVPEAEVARNNILAKTGLKKVQAGGQGKDIVMLIVVYSVICLVYIGITSWAKGEVTSDSDGKGVIYGVATILEAIGSIITPTVAVIISVVLMIIGLFGVLSQQRDKPEVYSKSKV